MTDTFSNVLNGKNLKVIKLEGGYTCSMPKDMGYIAIHKDKHVTIIISKWLPYTDRVLFKSDMILLANIEEVDLTIVERI